MLWDVASIEFSYLCFTNNFTIKMADQWMDVTYPLQDTKFERLIKVKPQQRTMSDKSALTIEQNNGLL